MIADYVNWGSYGNNTKDYIGVSDSSQDTIIKLYLSSAVAACDTYIGDTSALYTSFASIPSPIFTGILEYVRVCFENHSRTPGLTSKTVGPISESYSDSSEKLSLDAVKSFWDPYVVAAVGKYGVIRKWRC